MRDVSELLAAAGPRPGAPLDLDVAYDAPCHLQHAQRVQDAPLAVLGAIPGLTLRLLPGSDQCCGSAGIYSVLKPAMARAVLDAKIDAIAAARPRPSLVVTGNPGCLMQIGAGLAAAGLDVGVAHPVELLDASYQGLNAANASVSSWTSSSHLTPCATLFSPTLLSVRTMASGILFDFNGVIIDDEPQHCDALIATLAELGYPLDRETYYRDYLGFDDRECFRFTFAPKGEADEARIQDAIERKNRHYERAMRADMRLVPGAVDFVESAALAGHPLAIVSGAFRREIELVLELSGLTPHFAEIVAAEDVTACKPSPLGFNRAREALGLSAGRCVVIEDSLPGLAAAKAAGMRCAMLSTSHGAESLSEADVVWRDFVGRSPDHLPWAHA